MALRFAYWVLFFHLLFLLYGHGNGARDVAKQDKKEVEKVDLKEMNEPYIVGYKTTKEKESDYITGCKTAQGTKESNYIAGYRTAQGTKGSDYLAGYRTSQGTKGSNYLAGYRTSQGTKGSDYLTGYRTSQGTKGSDYLTGYKIAQGTNGSDYLTSYKTAQGTKGSDYLAGYRTSQGTKGSDYLTGYRTSQGTKGSDYLTGYKTAQGTNGSDYLTSYKTAQGTKGSDYLTSYKTAQGTKGSDYLAGYRTSHGTKGSDYITGYKTSQDTKDSDYITDYKTAQDSEEYLTQYNKHYGHDNGESDTAEEDSKQAEMAADEKEIDQQYEARYKTAQAKESNYKASYTTDKKKKKDQSYKAGSRNVKESDYITAYGGGKDSKQSSHMDHSDAFKSGFFTMDDLYVGRKMPLRFPINEFSHFLPREEADSIPFSISQLPNLLQLFSIPEGSSFANSMENTIQQCEALPIKGEKMFCATSLESMVDFVRSIITSWPKINLLTTTHPTMTTTVTQNYTVLRISKEIYAPKWVACHPLPYPYKVHYCHFIEKSIIFKVSLAGENGHKVDSVAVCHLDTSDWTPDYILFSQLGVKPGSSPICHFLPVKHLVWVPSPTTAAV